MFAERTRIEEMYSNKDKPTDIVTSNKLFDYYKEVNADRPGIRRDDK